MRIVLFSVLALGVAQPAPAPREVKFVLTGANTKIQFMGTKPDGKHEGGFGTLSGTATGTSSGLKIELDIDMNSIFTDTTQLTDHLKGPDFFNVKTHPTTHFVTTKIEKAGEVFSVTGNLSLCGKVKAITFPAKITLAADNITFTAEFKVNRHELGITAHKGKIDDDVVLRLNVNAKK